jgi:hypothetical protein
LIPLSDEDDLFGGSGKYRSLSFKGSPVIEYRNLTVLERVRKTQARDVDTGESKYFEGRDGKPDLAAPIWQWVTKLQLPEGFKADPDIVEEYGEDDGVRYLYVGGPATGTKGERSSRAAFAQMLREAGVRAVEPGGVINRFAFVAEGKAKSRAHNPPKFYEGAYTPPAPGSSDTSGVMGEGGNGAADDEPPF